MKNKFLLATTVLSLVTFNTNAGEIAADGLSATVNVSAEFMIPNTIKSVQDMSLGKLIIPANFQNSIVLEADTGDYNGLESYIVVLEEPQAGLIEVVQKTSDTVSISHPSTIQLTSEEGYQFPADILDDSGSSIDQEEITTGYVKTTYRLGMKTQPGDSDVGYTTGKYTGSFTVTLVVNN